MSSLISRYYESIAPRKGSAARNRIAKVLRSKRALQKKGEGPNVRASVLAHAAKKTAIKRKATIRKVAAETANMRKRFKKSYHQISVGANVRGKKAAKAAVHNASFTAGAGVRRNKRSAGSSALHNFTHYA